MSELKPCPFCGGTPEVLQRPDTLDGYFCAISCFCGGYSARAHQAATSDTKQGAYEKAKQRWNRRPAEPNEPLTLEQLRNMDGEPVWLKDGIGEGWFLASAIVGEKIYFCEKSITVGEPITGCGKTWLAYRRPPRKDDEV